MSRVASNRGYSTSTDNAGQDERVARRTKRQQSNLCQLWSVLAEGFHGAETIELSAVALIPSNRKKNLMTLPFFWKEKRDDVTKSWNRRISCTYNVKLF